MFSLFQASFITFLVQPPFLVSLSHTHTHPGRHTLTQSLTHSPAEWFFISLHEGTCPGRCPVCLRQSRDNPTLRWGKVFCNSPHTHANTHNATVWMGRSVTAAFTWLVRAQACVCVRVQLEAHVSVSSEWFVYPVEIRSAWVDLISPHLVIRHGRCSQVSAPSRVECCSLSFLGC